jgi:hypothetical protein
MPAGAVCQPRGSGSDIECRDSRETADIPDDCVGAVMLGARPALGGARDDGHPDAE